jgi:hypothetical protein
MAGKPIVDKKVAQESAVVPPAPAAPAKEFRFTKSMSPWQAASLPSGTVEFRIRRTDQGSESYGTFTTDSEKVANEMRALIASPYGAYISECS